MNVPTLTTKGIPQLRQEMARLSGVVQTKLARNATMAAARVVAKVAQARTPVRTGRLRAGIKAKRDPDWQYRTSQVISYANSSVWYGRLIELGTKKMAARSFLRAALDESWTTAVQRMTENLRRGIDREVKKQGTIEDTGDL